MSVNKQSQADKQFAAEMQALTDKTESTILKHCGNDADNVTSLRIAIGSVLMDSLDDEVLTEIADAFMAVVAFFHDDEDESEERMKAFHEAHRAFDNVVWERVRERMVTNLVMREMLAARKR
jgi:hypothetical protein